MKKPLDSQRKSPKQGRSKALVEAIYEATVRILPKVGSENVTTKKIADLAGVSIGSLYQYFPNKETLLVGVMDLALKFQMSKFHTKIDEASGKSMEETTAIMVDHALFSFLNEKEKIREIFRMAPELGQMPTILKGRQETVERVAEEMKKHYPGKTNEEYIRVSFIAVNSVMGVIQTMLYDETQTYKPEDLALELKLMLDSYFQKRTKP